VEREDVVHVLRNMVDAVRPGGLVLDLQVIRPNPRVEVDGELVCELDSEVLYANAEHAAASIDALVAAGELAEEAIDDHDVLKHYPSGGDLLENLAESSRFPLGLGSEARLQALEAPCVTRDRCRLRRLRRFA
jgi:hypothetical protein